MRGVVWRATPKSCHGLNPNVTSRRSDTYKAITSTGLEVSPGLLLEDPGTNLAKDKRYDQILHYPLHPSIHLDAQGNYSAPGGIIDFVDDDWKALYPGHPNLTFGQFKVEMSDHLPLWVQLNIWDQDLELSQLLADLRD